MKSLLVIIFALVYSVTLQAEYLRTIRIGTFPNEQSAKEALVKLQEFVQEHQNILDLQKEWDFTFKERRSGKYFITLAEPLRDRAVLQEVIDTLRQEYPDAYVTRLRSYKPYKKPVQNTYKKIDEEKIIPVSSVEEPLQADEVTKEEKVPETQTEPLITETAEVKVDSAEKNDTVKQPIDIMQAVDTIAQQGKKNASTQEVKKIIVKKDGTYEILFYVMSFISLILLGIGIYLKKRNSYLAAKEYVESQKYEQIQEEIEEKEKLISYVSHELRSPMTAVMGLSQLVLESDLNKLQRDYVEKIEKSSNYILHLLNDILDLSKIQAGKLKMEKTEFNINDILNYVYNVVSIQAKHNNLNLSVNVDNSVPSVMMGDPLRLGQVLINLLGNAIKFTKDGDVTLEVKKAKSFGETVVLEFVVADTGIGMTPEQVENLFESYYQADESISREFGGTGLGLSISKRLIEMMNGEIQVQSKKDYGTTFTFTLQFSLKDAENKRQYRLPSGKLLNKKVLVVDSFNKNAIPLMQSLGYFKYHVHNIPSFEDVDEKIEREPFDVVIVNLQNLTKNAILKIKNMQKNHDIKVVILSEMHSSLSDSMLEELVIDAYIQPPITVQSILNLMVDLYMKKTKENTEIEPPQKEKEHKYEGKKILIAEDNELNQKVIAGLLSKTGAELTFCENGQEAVDLLEKGIKFDLILMDINMPVMDGYKAAATIRKEKRFDTIPILALSANASEYAVARSLESGMQGHISKPIDLKKFYGKITEMFEMKHLAEVGMVESQSLNETYDNLSVSVGLAHCNNDKYLYKNVLKDFQKMYVNSAFTFQELCVNDQFKKARHLAMDIKDVSFNIGAYNLGETTAAMEYEFEKGKRSNWKEHIHAYNTQLKALLRDIERYLSKE